MEGFISNLLGTLNGVLTALARYPAWVHWIVMISIGLVAATGAVLIGWRWLNILLNDIRVDASLARAMRSTARRVGEAQSSADTDRFAATIVKLETARRRDHR